MTDVVRINIFVEGQTEETFVRDVLYQPFSDKNIFLTPILVRTSARGKGGISNYEKIKWQIDEKCKEDRKSFVTTMFDFYKLPNNFPGIAGLVNLSDPYAKVYHLEGELTKHINHSNFIPYISLHEFEALLFSDLQKFEVWFDKGAVNKLTKECQQFESPELVNNGSETAPSKRILKYCEGYDKVIHGSSIALSIGIGLMRNQCKHFDKWLIKLENLQINKF